jgi:hypothetical protein
MTSWNCEGYILYDMNMYRKGTKELSPGGVKVEKCDFLEPENGYPLLIICCAFEW